MHAIVEAVEKLGHPENNVLALGAAGEGVGLMAQLLYDVIDLPVAQAVAGLGRPACGQ